MVEKWFVQMVLKRDGKNLTSGYSYKEFDSSHESGIYFGKLIESFEETGANVIRRSVAYCEMRFEPTGEGESLECLRNLPGMGITIEHNPVQ